MFFLRASLVYQESVVLIRWLATVTSREAWRTGQLHDQLRAGLFVSMDEMRKVFSRGGRFLSLDERHRAEYFNKAYHAALNSY